MDERNEIQNEQTRPDGEEGRKVMKRVRRKSYDARKELMEWIKAILWAVVIAFVIRTFVFTVVRVDGPSMMPTLQNNDRLIVWRMFYKPHQDDIIIFHPARAPKDCYVKRVIATEGQEVFVDYEENAVYVDGKKIDEPYIAEAMRARYESKAMEVPRGCVFAMGDNRNNSSDSRDPSIGFIDESAILGKAMLRFWPFTAAGMLH